MHLFGLIFFAIIAVLWTGRGIVVALGSMRLPWLGDYQAATDAECPRVSVIFAARDEEEKLPQALATLLAIDYPQLEILAVNDRSSDRTGEILKEAAVRDSRLKVVDIQKLPEGWLGKPHALQQGYAASNGEYLLFTDADVQFRPDTIRRAVSLMRMKQASHLTLMCE